MKKIILIILVVVVVGIGGALFFLTGDKAPTPFNHDPGDYFVTDMADSIRLLKIDMVITMADDKKQEFYTENNHRIRNVVIQSIRGKTESYLRTAEAQATLSEAILTALRLEFETEDFLKIYYNEFVIQ